MPKSHLSAVVPATHGGLDYAELRARGILPAEVLDFSVNINPAPIPEELRRVIAEASIGAYPDSRCQAVREAAAEAYGVTPDQVVAGNGSSELIWLVGLAFIRAGDTVLVRQPTFGEYAVAARIQGAEVATYEGSLEAALGVHRPRVMFVCNPNNPTADHIPPASLADLARQHPATLLVVDEAYADFVSGRPTSIGRRMPDNLLVLRSLTKFSALAGLRLGLAFGQRDAVEALWKVKPPWNVNAVAQAAGEYALGRPDLLPDLDALAVGRQELVDGLRNIGLSTWPTTCNFFLMHVSDAAGLRSRLLARRILVRDCASFGLPDHIRIAVRSHDDNCRLLLAMEAVL